MDGAQTETASHDGHFQLVCPELRLYLCDVLCGGHQVGQQLSAGRALGCEQLHAQSVWSVTECL